MKTVRGLRWWIIGLVALATVINYIHRGSLAIMWPDISRDLQLSKEQYAGILSLFMIMYAIGHSVSGRLYDIVGTRIGFVLSITVWSVAAGFHSIAQGMTSLGIFRGLLGLGEAGPWPGSTKVSAEWFPIRERALAQGIFNAGASVGAVVSAPIVALLYLWLGWRATFIVIGVIGIIWIVPWWIINKSGVSSHPWLSEDERQMILGGQQPAGVNNPLNDRMLGWSELFGYKQSWAVMVSRFCLDPIWWLFISWLPLYLAERFGFDIKQIGLFAWVPYVGAGAGSLLGGWSSGWLMKRGWSVNKARKWTITAGGVIMVPSLLLTAYASTPLVAVLLIAVILFGFQVSMNNIQTLPSDFFAGKSVGTLAGLGGTTSSIGVLISIWLVPIMTKVSYAPFFLLSAALVPLGVLSVFVFGGEIKRVNLKDKPN